MRASVSGIAALAALSLAACMGDGDGASGASLMPMAGMAQPPVTGETSGGEPPVAVGVYRAPSVTLLLDADGGFEWRRPGAVQRGRWRMLSPETVELAPADGTAPSRLALREESVVDPTGAELRAARAP